jgi:hypothetical protein
MPPTQRPRWDPEAGRRFLRFAFWSPAEITTIVASLLVVALLPAALKTLGVVGGALVLAALARRRFGPRTP